MASTECRKSKKRKNKKGVKNAPPPEQPVQQPEISSTKEEIEEIQKIMDAKDDNALPVITRGPRCLLCGKQRPPGSEVSDDEDMDDSAAEGRSALPLWVCVDCRKKVEDDKHRKMKENERQAETELTALETDFSFLSDMTAPITEPTTPNGTVCTCQACTERRQIEAEHEQETQELQQYWMELRHIVRYLYRENGTSCSEDTESVPVIDAPKIRWMVGRLCTRDPHQLYQRLESQAREYVIEMKVRLLKQLTSGHKTPPQAKQFVSLLLEEYSHLCTGSKKLATFFVQLEKEHLKKFNLTWELHNEHLFQSIIYTDPLIQNSLPMLITQLRLGAASKDSYHEDTYHKILHRYLKFDDEMTVVSVVWRDCQQLLDEFGEEQAALKAKQKMLKEDWEFFKAQRKILEQQVLKNTNKVTVPTSNNHCLETQFTETMRNLLAGTKTTKDEYPEHVQCPNCNRKRCPCDECTISHMITCGIISPEVQESMSPHNMMPAFNQDPSRYIIDITPPSMSSTGSSSGSSSPVPMDAEKLSLPFDDVSDTFPNEDAIFQQIEDDLRARAEKDAIELENNAKNYSQYAECCAAEGDGPKKTDRCGCVQCLASVAKQMQSQEVQCQCHACQKGTVFTSLPQPVSPPPRPAALHLYPHIHGSNVLHTMSPAHHSRLNPQLYELHHTNPVRPKPILQSTHKPFNLDLDSHEALHEHIYHAYGEWENVLESSVLFGSHKGVSSSEYLQSSPSQLLNGTPFFADNMSSQFPKGVSQTTKAAANFNLKPINRNLYPVSSMTHNKPSLLSASETCTKHCTSQLNSFANMNSHTSVSASSASTASLASKLAPELLRTAAKDNLLGHNALSSLAGLNLTQCSNALNQQNQLSSKMSTTNPLSSTCATSGNVSIGTSTQCTDPDCDGHHGDGCHGDDDDDSCSEQSSSASASNQKDGKYCDCCYCEFFGHGNPPVAPTSRNYNEMRDKLRLRLKKKNEVEQCDDFGNEIETDPETKEDPVEQLGLDELVKFINGDEEKKPTKAAKKARQKQKKRAEERDRKQEEQRLRELERLHEQQQQDKKKKTKLKHKQISSNCLTDSASNETTHNVIRQHMSSHHSLSTLHKYQHDERSIQNRIVEKVQQIRQQQLLAEKLLGSSQENNSAISPNKKIFEKLVQNEKLKTQDNHMSCRSDLENGRVVSSERNLKHKLKTENGDVDKSKKDYQREVKVSMKGQSNGKIKMGATPVTPQKETTKCQENKENNQSPRSTDSSPKSNDSPGTPNSGKSKKGRKKGKSPDDIDEIFLPKQDLDLENGEMDEFEKELEEFKRFCFDSQPSEERTKVQVNMNLKDILTKKKVPTSVGCS